MFARIMRKSLAKRKSRICIAMVAVLMGASIASALLTTSFGITEKLGETFRKFGSNILVTPKSNTIDVGLPGINLGSVTEQRYIEESELWKIKRIANWSANVLGYAPFLYQVVSVESGGEKQDVVLAGTYFEYRETKLSDNYGHPWITGIKEIAPYWEVDGNWVSDQNDTKSSMVGSLAAENLGLKKDSIFTVNYTNPETKSTKSYALEVVGIVSTGGVEDSQIFVNLNVAQNISGRENKVHSVQVSALCTKCPAEMIASEIEKVLPDVQAKSVKQLVKAEEQIMMSLEQTMLLVTVVALVASALGVMTTMTTTVIERRKEIGLMKAIGAENRRIASLFLVEAAIVGLMGGVLGYIAGHIFAQFIGQSVFNSAIPLVPVVVPIVIILSVGVALLASALPVKRALQIEPAIVLRGE